MSSNKSQIVSKERVADHGEVYTADREVKAMVDLVGTEAERIESTFLEPACGDGNFLVEILERKLNVVFKKYRKSQTECEKYLVVAVGSIYGIDILPDNVDRCKKRLFQLFRKMYHQKCKSYYNTDFEFTIRYILDRNIVLGDALTMKDPDGEDYITFSQWSVTTGCNVKRRDFYFKEIIRVEENKSSPKTKQKTLLDEESEIVDMYIDQPIKEYPAVHYLRLMANE